MPMSTTFLGGRLDSVRGGRMRALKPAGTDSERSGNTDKLMVEDDQLVGTQCQARVRSPLIIVKLYFENVRREGFNHGPDLTPAQASVRNVFEQSNHSEWVDGLHSFLPLYNETTCHPRKVFATQHNPVASNRYKTSGASHLKV